MTCSECKGLIRELGLHPSRARGQNFLTDANILRLMVQIAAVRRGETILEIGAGLGVLTEALLAAGAEVVAVEVDPTLAAFLHRRFARRKRLRILAADVLQLEPPAATWAPKVVSNLPYSISTAILRQLVEAVQPPKQMVLMVQREVGERLVARPATAAYGLLSVFTQVKFRVRLCHVVSRRCFYPMPEVDSAIVELHYAPHPLLREETAGLFAELVRLGFNQRRKQFGKLLRHSPWGERVATEALRRAGIPAEARAETLGVDQFLQLARELGHGGNV